jgi:hypothetical protein
MAKAQEARIFVVEGTQEKRDFSLRGLRSK